MEKIKKVLQIIFISVLSILLVNTNAYATNVQVTDENLNEALQKIKETDVGGMETITVKDNIIEVTDSEIELQIKYDLTEDPTFTIEVPVQTGMTYEEYETEIEKTMGLYIPYIAVANIQGAEFEDSAMYFVFAYLEGASGLYSEEKPAIVIDDISVSDGVTIEKTDDPNTYYASEFPEKVMEYTNKVYKDKMVVNDKDELDSFELTIEKQDVTETSCKLVSTLTVNKDADFSKLNEADNPLDDDTGITKENADYTIELKVGQKCKIESSEKLTGYSFYGNDCVEVSDGYNEITAIKAGETNGYLYIGDEHEMKSIFVTVVENVGNQNLEAIILKIGNVENNEGTDNKEEPKEESSNKNEFVVTVPNNNTQKDNTVVNKTEIPKAGSRNITTIIALGVLLVILIGIQLKKYKGI